MDPQLGPLASNGGPTQTHALLQGSPAINAAYQFPMPAADGCELRDQRGVPHPQGGRCDMGAFESGNANVFVTSFTLVDADADVDLFPIRTGEQLRLGDLPAHLSIRASVSGVAGSVVFAFDANATFQTETNAPYALGGDNPAGNYTPVVFTNGAHVVRATPFAGGGGSGAAGGSLELRFDVVGGVVSKAKPFSRAGPVTRVISVMLSAGRAEGVQDGMTFYPEEVSRHVVEIVVTRVGEHESQARTEELTSSRGRETWVPTKGDWVNTRWQ